MKSSYQEDTELTRERRRIRVKREKGAEKASLYYSRASSIVKRAVYLLNFSKRISQFPRQLDANICENCSAISKLENWGGLRKGEKLPAETSRSFELQNEYRFALRDLCNFSSIFFSLGLLCLNRSRPIRTANFENIYEKFISFFKTSLSSLSLWKLRKTVSKISLGYLFFKDYYIALHCVPPCNRITLCAILPRNLPQLRNCNGTISCNNNDGGWKNIFFSFLSFRRKDPRRFSAANSVAIMLCLLSESKEMKKI